MYLRNIIFTLKIFILKKIKNQIIVLNKNNQIIILNKNHQRIIRNKNNQIIINNKNNQIIIRNKSKIKNHFHQKLMYFHSNLSNHHCKIP